jgi:hypothetical protein
MNERIRDLGTQAGLYVDLKGTPWPRAMSAEECEAAYKKFALLIVRECMACSTWVGKMNTNLVEPVHTAHAINQRIKQHFGVEE